MCNLVYYSKNFRKTNGSLWNFYQYFRSCEYVGNNERITIFCPIKDSESFDYKAKLIGSLGNNLPAVSNLVKAELRDTKIVVQLKNLRKFMFNLGNKRSKGKRRWELYIKCSRRNK